MGYHTTPIPLRRMKGDSPQYYVGQLTDDGDYVCISDEDPRDDVRAWDALKTARWAATAPKQCGYRVDAIVMVSDTGQTLYAVTEEEGIRQMLVSCPDFGSW